MNKQPSATPPKRRSAPIRLLRWLFSWHMIRRYLFCLACLATLFALFWAEENWRGKRAWEKYKQAEEAKGENFDFKAFILPSVPDDQNFASTPFLSALYDFNPKPLKQGQSLWRDTNALRDDFSIDAVAKTSNARGDNWTLGQLTDLGAWATGFADKRGASSATNSPLTRTQAATEVLRGLEKFTPVLEELRTASQRPYARFNIAFNNANPGEILFSHLSLMKRVGMMFHLRASAELALGQTDQALKDTEMHLYLGDTIKNEPFLISGLVRLALFHVSLQPIWEGLAGHQWSDAQLAELTQRLEKTDLLKEYGATLRGERAFNIAGLEYLRTTGKSENLSDDPSTTPPLILMPSGWFYRNELVISRLYQERALLDLDAANHRAYPSNVLSTALLEQEFRHGFSPYNMFARLLFPAVAPASMKYAAAQTKLDEAILACALERYRLAHGAFPETLDSLSPRFIAHIPHDLFTGEPLKYHRTDDGHFTLYSIGWNGKDDGGEMVMTKSENPSVDLTQGDWVWPQYPAP